MHYLYEGKTVSYICEDPNDDNKLYNKEDGYVIPINNPELLKPFVPFSRDSDGGYNSLFYGSNNEKGDIIIDCSYTKFFLEMTSSGTPRYIQNIICWLAAFEKHNKNEGLDGSEFRPKLVEHSIDSDKWQKFKPKPIENMKTLFAVDCSDSTDGYPHYYSKIRELVNKYYKTERGDKFYTWGSYYHYKTNDEMNQYINNEEGTEGTDSSKIAEIANEVKNENFEHLIIVTDGQVDTSKIDLSDKLVKEYKLKFSYVSSYLINLHNDANESVGCPYSRECPGITYIINKDGTEKTLATLTQEDRNNFININNINNLNDFNLKYDSLYRAIRAECLGKEKDQNLENKLISLENKIGVNDNEFKKKINILKKLNGGMRNISGSTVA